MFILCIAFIALFFYTPLIIHTILKKILRADFHPSLGMLGFFSGLFTLMSKLFILISENFMQSYLFAIMTMAITIKITTQVNYRNAFAAATIYTASRVIAFFILFHFLGLTGLYTPRRMGTVSGLYKEMATIIIQY